jgi:hypothetical protein
MATQRTIGRFSRARIKQTRQDSTGQHKARHDKTTARQNKDNTKKQGASMVGEAANKDLHFRALERHWLFRRHYYRSKNIQI